MALAAMDSEPVVECEKLAIENFRTAMEGIGHIRRTLDETFGGLHGTHVEPDVLAECKAICDAIYAAYRHAQPAPAAPVCTCPSGDGSLRWPCPVHPGNSPVIPDGWTGNEKANAALMMLDRIETVDPVDDDRIDGIKRIVRELAAAPHDTPALNSVQSVVTVPGKWIPVSERMPDDEQEVLTINKMGHRFVSFFDKHSGLFFDRLDAPAACCIEHVLVTHWMPLPAAPQEVNHG
ncbi:TPA: DUF551 domain-containing protein [Klebsiella pneumoniae]|nr:DUF551 domain-containing protein [Klebsiella pneumoniae]HDY6304790.1 DUF551 domain-containing protein [Klebsiella pneumoniae]HDY6688683.1 DUF551 domain-containing protein [Klebsiella pneumoniae]HDY6693986.1 DUF551 domain-containing protein [Klebsiella pneumoniae]HDY6913996.1 DUF551 domain-containing protein [Klebsiella pneumoniae]